MGINLNITSDSWAVGSKEWLKNRKGLDTCRSITIDISLFNAGHYRNGFIPSGIALAKQTSSGMYGPYGGTFDEIQVLTVGGAGLTSFTVTFGGQTTGAIAAAATAATVQTALQALSTIGAGNVVVSGVAGGPWTLTFAGTLANTDVAQVTATPTGGTGTVTPSTTQAGGADAGSGGLETCTGLLLDDVRTVDSSGNAFTVAGCALFWEGIVDTRFLPTFTGVPAGAGEIDAAAKVELPSIRFESGS